jgi:hypothetical protein
VRGYNIDYQGILAMVPSSDVGTIAAHLKACLPDEWAHAYRMSTSRPTNLWRFPLGNFEYAIDHFSEIESLHPRADYPIEDRVVAVWGWSDPTPARRSASRQRGWGQPSKGHLRITDDKGHFIAHSLGGSLDVNIFAQNREVNRGCSEEGKLFTSMERYCRRYPGTFCFNRPLYNDDSFRPAALEFGILKRDGTLSIHTFNNP